MSIDIATLIQRVQQTQHGFTDIRAAADEIIAGQTPAASRALAEALLASDVYQARMLAALIFGRLAPHSAECLELLRATVSRDADWRVQEMLAQAFDGYCAAIGYAQALPLIDEWLADPHPHARRAVTEGLRIWTSRPFFREYPAEAVRRLGRLHADESAYVRKSVGNALRDISRKHAELVRAELAGWDRSDQRVVQTYRLASKRLEIRD